MLRPLARVAVGSARLPLMSQLGTAARRSSSCSSPSCSPSSSDDGRLATSGSSGGLAALAAALGGEHAAVEARLANLWGLPPELLFERRQAILRLLGPSGTPAHALWVLVRSPQLRHASEHSLRGSLRRLMHAASCVGIEQRSVVLDALYRHPWMLDIIDTPSPAQPAAARGPGAHATEAGSDCGGDAGALAPWKHELAALLLERCAARARRSGGGVPSPTLASAAVRAYLAMGELAAAVSRAAAWVRGAASGASLALPATGRTLSASNSTCSSCTSSTSSASSSSGGGSGSGIDEVMRLLAEERQEQLLLQQLLATCPHLVALPPELLLMRWHHLLAVLQDGTDGGAAVAQQLVACSPWVLADARCYD